MYLQRDRKIRIVHVDAHTPGGKFQDVFVGITTAVGMNGDWAGTLQIRCAAAENDLEANVWDVPVMLGRSAIPLPNLTEQLIKTIEEREQVVAARKMGIDGPYTFEEAAWTVPDLGF